MNTDIEVIPSEAQAVTIRFNTAPSLRIPVTAANRALLRRLRSAELSAWEAADHRAQANFDACPNALFASVQAS